MIKKCTHCSVIANTEEETRRLFSKGRNICKSCRTARDRAYPQKDRDYYRDKSYQSLYGITLEDYNALYTSQQGKCMICEEHEDTLKKRLYVDHCHTTDKVRGLLCQSCNTLIGFSYDDIRILDNAKAYLISTKCA